MTQKTRIQGSSTKMTHASAAGVVCADDDHGGASMNDDDDDARDGGGGQWVLRMYEYWGLLGGAGADIETPPKEEDDDGKGLKGFTLQMYIAVKRDNIICYFMRIVAFFHPN